jgi:hypothetical protein
MKNESTREMQQSVLKIYMDRGPSFSAIMGAKIVAMRAAKLQMPIAVAPKRVEKTWLWTA